MQRCVGLLAMLLASAVTLGVDSPATAPSASEKPVAEAGLTVDPKFMAGDFFAKNWMKTVPHGTAFATTRPAEVKKEPAYTGAPLYGSVTFGDAEKLTPTWIVYDDAADGIYIDANRDGDLTNDPAVKWENVTEKDGKKGYTGSFVIAGDWTTGPGVYGVKMYRSGGQPRGSWQTIAAPHGKITLDGVPYDTFVYDSGGSGLFGTMEDAAKKVHGNTVFLDLDHDGTFQPVKFREVIALGAPMQVGDKWYSFRVTNDGKTLSAFTAVAPPPKPVYPVAKAGEMAPDFAFETAEGKAAKFSDRKGKVVLMDMWATWCGPCLAAMPRVQALHEKLKDNPKVEVLGMCTLDEKEKFTAWIEKNKATYTFNFGFDGGRREDGSTNASRAYGISAIPTTYVIGPDGMIVEVVTGFTPANEQKVIQALEKLGVKVE